MTSTTLSDSTRFSVYGRSSDLPVGTRFTSLLDDALLDLCLLSEPRSIGPVNQSWINETKSEGIDQIRTFVFDLLSTRSIAVTSAAIEALRDAVGRSTEALDWSLLSTLLDATLSTGEMRNAFVSGLGLDRPGPDSSSQSPAEDRRLYALAAVDRVQQLLRLKQEDVADLIHVSRPSLWEWKNNGRTPQERSVRHLYDVVGALDLLVDAMGGEASFDPSLAATQLRLPSPLSSVLKAEDGPRSVLSALFASTREQAPRPSLFPSLDDLLDRHDDDLEDTALSPPPRPRELRRVTRKKQQ